MFASHAQTSNEEKLSYYGFDDEVHNYINEIEKTGKRSPRTDCVNCGAKSGSIGGIYALIAILRNLEYVLTVPILLGEEVVEDLFPVAVVVMVHAI